MNAQRLAKNAVFTDATTAKLTTFSATTLVLTAQQDVTNATWMFVSHAKQGTI